MYLYFIRSADKNKKVYFNNPSIAVLQHKDYIKKKKFAEQIKTVKQYIIDNFDKIEGKEYVENSIGEIIKPISSNDIVRYMIELFGYERISPVQTFYCVEEDIEDIEEKYEYFHTNIVTDIEENFIRTSPSYKLKESQGLI